MSEVSTPVTITKSNFSEEVENSPIPVVLDFWAAWCGPCRMIGPILDRLSGEYAGKVKVGKINVDQERQLAGMHGIRGIPTLVVYNDGQPIGEIVGFYGEQPLNDLFADLANPDEARAASAV